MPLQSQRTHSGLTPHHSRRRTAYSLQIKWKVPVSAWNHYTKALASPCLMEQGGILKKASPLLNQEGTVARISGCVEQAKGKRRSHPLTVDPFSTLYLWSKKSYTLAHRHPSHLSPRYKDSAKNLRLNQCEIKVKHSLSLLNIES